MSETEWRLLSLLVALTIGWAWLFGT